MKGRFETFERDIRLVTQNMDPEAISTELAIFARAQLAEAIGEGEASDIYDRFVNGREGLPESAVNAPGPIVYRFIWWPVLIKFALQELHKRSPRRSGRFASSFIVISGGRVVRDYQRLRADDEVIITNYQPYIRKIEGPRHGSGRKLFSKMRGVMRRKFGARGSFRFDVVFLQIGRGVHPMMPYRLKRSHGRRKEMQAGAPITYPALIMNMTG